MLPLLVRLILISTFFYSVAFSAELLVIQTISNSGKSFVTRNGKSSGVSVGVRGTFTGNNVSIIARAKTVTRNYTQWLIDNQDAIVPFKKDEIVTYHNTSEYVWTLMPDDTRKKFMKDLIHTEKSALQMRTGLTRGISQSVSEVAPAENLQIGGYMLEVMYEKEYSKNISLLAGFRIESEVINLNEASLTASRQIAIVEGLYYLGKMESFYNGQIFGGLALGYGLSSTSTPGSQSSGPVMILPAVKLGLLLPLSNQYRFMFDTALESLNIREGSDTASEQTTNQVNLRYGIGLKRYF
jgi:hypothetical protein